MLGHDVVLSHQDKPPRMMTCIQIQVRSIPLARLPILEGALECAERTLFDKAIVTNESRFLNRTLQCPDGSLDTAAHTVGVTLEALQAVGTSLDFESSKVSVEGELRHAKSNPMSDVCWRERGNAFHSAIPCLRFRVRM